MVSESLRKLPNDWTGWDQIWYTSADSSGNGPRYARGHFRGFHGVNNSKVWIIYQTAGPIGTTFGTRLRIHREMDIG